MGNERILMLCVSGAGIRLSHLTVAFGRALTNGTAFHFYGSRQSTAVIKGGEVEACGGTKGRLPLEPQQVVGANGAICGWPIPKQPLVPSLTPRCPDSHSTPSRRLRCGTVDQSCSTRRFDCDNFLDLRLNLCHDHLPASNRLCLFSYTDSKIDGRRSGHERYIVSRLHSLAFENSGCFLNESSAKHLA